MLVLGALVVAMTVTSGMLMVLEPGPIASGAGVALQSIDVASQSQDTLVQTDVEQARWGSIVIHDSRTPQGSAMTLDHVHRQLGRGGLGYHFVIDNGPGADDGKIEVGSRWSGQTPGSFFDHQAEPWPDAIGICLIGDGERGRFTEAQLGQLVRLVQQLQQRHGITKESVFAQIGSQTATTSFPDAWFRQQLLN